MIRIFPVVPLLRLHCATYMYMYAEIVQYSPCMMYMYYTYWYVSSASIHIHCLQVIICTDGLANKGVGTLDGEWQ